MRSNTLFFKLKSNVFIVIVFTLISVLSYSQTRQRDINAISEIVEDRNFIVSDDKDLKRHIDAIGLSVAKRLMSCCSSWGGNDVYSSVDYYLVKMNSTTGVLTIPMKVGWKGSLSGSSYWIEGKLVRYLNGRNKWIKIRDNGGFQSGCSNSCIR